MAYNVGDAVPLVYTISAAATVVLTVTDPDGTTSNPALTQGGSPPAVTYSATVPATKAGLWMARFVATGAVTDAEEEQFIVEPVAAATLYASEVELRSSIGDTATRADVGLLTAALRAASRTVDDWCQRPGRKFWLDPAVTVRTYRPRDLWCARVDDIGSATGVVVKTDTNADGTFETTWDTADFQLEPLNASAAGGAYRFNRIVAVGAKTFPYPIFYGSGQRPTLQVTARFGWSQVPDPVRTATLLLAARYYRRKDAVFGSELGGGDFGPIRITRQDSDVMALLQSYKLPTGYTTPVGYG